MTAYLQVHDILDRAQETHRRLSEFYARLSDVATDVHVKMLLGYLNRQEERFAESLESYSATGSQKVLNMWFQFPPESRLQRTLSQIDVDLDGDMTLDDVREVAMRFDDCLADYYEEALENAEGAEVVDTFYELFMQEKHEKARLFRSVESLKHI